MSKPKIAYISDKQCSIDGDYKGLDQLSDRDKDGMANISYDVENIHLFMNSENKDPEIKNDIDNKNLNLRDYFVNTNSTDKLFDSKYQTMLDYKIVGVKNDPSTGFSAIALMDKNGNISISYAGTNQGIDMEDNLQTNFIGESAQSKLAQQFYDDIKNENPYSGIYLYGHSKGGELVARVMVNNQDDPNIIAATVFNPQPLNPHHLKGDISVLKSDRVTAFRNENDIVSHLGDASDDVYNVIYVKSNYEKDKSNSGVEFFIAIYNSILAEHNTGSNTYDENGNAVRVDDISENAIHSSYKGISVITQAIQNIIAGYQNSNAIEKAVISKITLDIILVVLINWKVSIPIIVTAVIAILGFVVVGHIVEEIKELITTIKNYFENLFRKVFGKSPKAVATSEIDLDLNVLEDIHLKLKIVQNKLIQAEEDLKYIRNTENLAEIKSLFNANRLIPNKNKIQKCINYLDGTKEAFQTAENNIKNFV